MTILRRTKGSPLDADDHDQNALLTGGYDDVAALLVNTTETYSFWSAGDQFRAGDYLYQVLDAGTAQPNSNTPSLDHHLETAGGLKVQPVSENRVHNAQAWGVLPDGVDNTERFRRLWNYIRGDDKPAFVEFPYASTSYRLYQLAMTDYAHDVTFRGVGGQPHIFRTDNWAADGPTSRMFECWRPTDGTTAKLIFENLHVDANRWGEPTFDKTFALQQSHAFNCEGLWVDDEPASYVNLILRNVKVSNVAGDGVSMYNNCKVELYDVHFHNNFRGAVTRVGHNTHLLARNVLSTDDLEPSNVQVGEYAPGTWVGGFHTGFNDEIEGLDGARHKYANAYSMDIDGWRFEQGAIKFDAIPHYRVDLEDSVGAPTDNTNVPRNVVKGLVVPPTNVVNFHQMQGNAHYIDCEIHGRVWGIGFDQVWEQCRFFGRGSSGHMWPAYAERIGFSERLPADVWNFSCLDLSNWQYSSSSPIVAANMAQAPLRIIDTVFQPTEAMLTEATAEGKDATAIKADTTGLAETGDYLIVGSPTTEDRGWYLRTRRKHQIVLTGCSIMPIAQPWREASGNGPNVFGMFDIGVRINGCSGLIRNSEIEATVGTELGDRTTDATGLLELKDNHWFCPVNRVVIQSDGSERYPLFIESDFLEWEEANDTFLSAMRAWSDRKIIVMGDPNGASTSLTDFKFLKIYQQHLTLREYIRLPVKAITPGTVTLKGIHNTSTLRFTLTDNGSGTLTDSTVDFSFDIDYTTGLLSNPVQGPSFSLGDGACSLALTCTFDSAVSGLPGDVAILSNDPATRWKCTNAPAAAPAWSSI